MYISNIKQLDKSFEAPSKVKHFDGDDENVEHWVRDSHHNNEEFIWIVIELNKNVGFYLGEMAVVLLNK